VFQSDLKWLVLLCFPGCRYLPCCRPRSRMAGSARVLRGGGGRGGRCNGGRHRFIPLRRRFTEPSTLPEGPRTCHLEMDNYPTRPRRPVGSDEAALHGEVRRTTKVSVYHPPSSQHSGHAVSAAESSGNGHVSVHRDGGDIMERASRSSARYPANPQFD